MTTRRKLFLALTIFAIGSASVSAQHIDLRLNGLKIGAKYGSIVKKLGKPVSDRRWGNVPCGDDMRTLRYDGLEIRLESGGDNPLGLYRVVVTKSKWSMSGIRIGDSRTTVTRKFGTGRSMSEHGQRFLSYSIVDGYANFYFRKNRLAKVEWEFNFC